MRLFLILLILLTACSQEIEAPIVLGVSGIQDPNVKVTPDEGEKCGKLRNSAAIDTFNKDWKQYVQQANQFLITKGGGFCIGASSWSIDRVDNKSIMVGTFGRTGRAQKLSRELTVAEIQQIETAFAQVRSSKLPNLVCSPVSDGCGGGIQIRDSITRTFYPENQSGWVKGNGYILNESFENILALVKAMMPEDICNTSTCEDVKF